MTSPVAITARCAMKTLAAMIVIGPIAVMVAASFMSGAFAVLAALPIVIAHLIFRRVFLTSVMSPAVEG